MKNTIPLLFLFSVCSIIADAQSPELLEINGQPPANSVTENFIDFNGVLLYGFEDKYHGKELWRSDGTKEGTYLVKDLLVDPYEYAGNSNPQNFTRVGDIVFFSITGQLWKTDGTAAGTQLVKELHNSTDFGKMVGLNNILYFSGYDSDHRDELWRSDGTEAGTYLVKDITPLGFDGPELLTESNGTLYFKKNDEVHGTELWKSDGTEAGTVMVKDIAAGDKAIMIEEIIPFGSGVLLNLDAPGLGNELWFSDGTEAGTQLVLDIRLGNNGSNPEQITVYNGIAYFRAKDALHGKEIWRSDGTALGTYMLKDIRPGDAGSAPQEFTVSNGLLFFSAQDETGKYTIWKTDGTAEGTLPCNQSLISSTKQTFLTDNCGTLFFVGGKEDNPELWSTDGTFSGTHKISEDNDDLEMKYLTSSNCHVYYSLGPLFSENLWISDGTEEGTQEVEATFDITAGSFPSESIVISNHLFFVADDGDGPELWAKDLSTSLIYLVKNIDTNHYTFQGGYPPHEYEQLLEFKGLLYFSVHNHHNGNVSLWKSDGTDAGTVLVKDLNPGGDSEINELTRAGDFLFFDGEASGTENELWRTDGTEAGTVLASDINPGTGSSTPHDLVNVNGVLFFLADDGVHGVELWKYDGGTASLVKDLRPGSASCYCNTLTAANGMLMFEEKVDPYGESGLWKSDGTPGGTEPVMPDFPGAHDSGIEKPVAALGTFFLWTSNSSTGVIKLWKSDGTEEGTKQVKSFDGYLPNTPFDFNGDIYFFADDGEQGAGLWKSNGKVSGTKLVKDISSSTPPSAFEIINDKLFFIVDDEISGFELWTTDGTECGTFIVTEVSVGPEYSDPPFFAGDADYIYFSAYTNEHGEEPYQFPVSGITSGLEALISAAAICPGDAVSVSLSFPSACSVNAGNVYTVQLSDATGGFSNPIVIGTLASINLSENISCTIPNLTPSGSGYRIRTIASNPATTGKDNGTDINITCPKPENLAVSNITNSAATLTWSSVSCAEKFKVKYRKEGTSAFTVLHPASNIQSLTGLSPNTSYEAKVQSKCAKNPNAFSSFTSLIHWTTGQKLTNDEELIAEFSVYPNPTSDFAAIQFSLSNSSDVEITLFDLQGRKVKTFVDRNFSEGIHTLPFSVGDLAKGIYLLQLKTDSGMAVQKLVVE